MNTADRTRIIEVFSDLSNLMVVIDSNKDAIKESIKSLSETTSIDKKLLNKLLRAYHVGNMESIKEESTEMADLVDFMRGEQE
jgi:hypothetical protein